MKRKGTKIWRILLFAIPLVLGAMGFLQAGESSADSLFFALCMYGLNIQDSSPNLWVEVARWTAPLATAGGALMLFASVRRKLSNFSCYLRGDSIAVYGTQEETEDLLEQLEGRGIDGGKRFVRAHRYILLNGETENLAFYRENRKALKGCMVFLKCESLRAQDSVSSEMRLFCPQEVAARLFWKRRCLYEISVRQGHKLSIVFLGFGKLGEELLVQALQNNIFHPQQCIEYHIFGGDASFLDIRHELGEIEDEIIFHQEPWYRQRALLEEAEALVVLEQERQLELLQQLLLTTARGDIDVFAVNTVGMELLEAGGRLRVNDWKREAQKPEHILSDVLFDQAKRINLRYASLYDGVSQTEEEKETQWRKLDSFTRCSNISAADYHEVRLKMLAAMGQPADVEKMESACLELLAHLEHIRWCRYHWLNNWRYGIPDNGKRKDAARRIHMDLVPYGQLTEADKEKDRENIRILLS